LPLVSRGEHKATYLNSDGTVQLTASHAYGRRNRRALRVDHSKIAADPFRPDENREVSMSNYIVFDLPDVGYTNTEALAVYTGFKTLFTGSTDALIVKLLGGES